MENMKKWFSKYPESVPNEIDIPLLSVPEMLQQTVRSYGNHEAISFYGKTFTYNELAKMVYAFTSSLQQSNVQKGDRVAIMLPNCPQYVVSYYGALSAGAIVTQINPMLVERELEYILNDSGAETIIVFNAFYPLVKLVQLKTNLKNIITVSLEPTETAQVEDYTFESFLGKQNGQVLPIEIMPEDDIAVLQYTGGTTGRSKGAMLSHRNIVANAYQSGEFFKNEIQAGKEKCLTVIPLFHVFGMSSCMNLTILFGNSMIMLPRFDLEEVLQTIKREQPTLFPGVPTMYVAITNHPNAEDYHIESIRICNSGSAPMPVELLKEFERKTGAKILEGYGLSEASPVTHCNPAFADRKPGTVGLGLPNTAYKIVDVATGTIEVPVGELGEIIISGPQVMKGYWNMPEETAVTLRDGWLFTGDIARMDEDGYVSIVDRKKDLIIASGYNIYPRDIEEILYEHPCVQEAVVIGVPDQYRGETVKAFIVLKSEKSVTKEEMFDYCRAHIASYKVPTQVEFRNELPKTNVGKILRRALREEVLNSGS
ncbi:long-chain acyl-CoA synthetase [Metabacillus crassostreae]|uniref:long-chain-fatty-acid--CoA ligase n=1 Tax=Metabacillus crassostreae TaxID=929098 RepID=UPI0019577F64|nr:long-chain fatty acid--CoA ligase [Metabacillus crassostreae]MBM7603603.1 long-chain acyl-CoA synthetase [Metabacillus crassostreae]